MICLYGDFQPQRGKEKKPIRWQAVDWFEALINKGEVDYVPWTNHTLGTVCVCVNDGREKPKLLFSDT